MTKHACAIALFATAVASAAGHREAPAIANDPAADNTDLWAWTTKTAHDKLQVVMAFNPFEEPAAGPIYHGFSDEVLYELHITGSGTSIADKWVYQFRFTTTPAPRVDVADMSKPLGGGKEPSVQIAGRIQTLTVTKVSLTGVPTRTVIANNIPVAPPNYGPRSQAILQGLGLASSMTYNDAYAATFIRNTTEGGRVWAGPRDDGFYADLGGLHDFLFMRAKGTAQDALAGFNCHAIAIEIPGNLVTSDGTAPGNTPGNRSTVGVWASTSRRQASVLNRNGTSTFTGPWVQVSRVGLPLMNDLMIGIQDKDLYNRSRPAGDLATFGGYFLNPILVRDAELVGQYAAGTPVELHQLAGTSAGPLKATRLDIIDVMNLKNIPTPNAHNIALSGTGDVLRVDLAVDSQFPNGRPLGAGYTGVNQNQENDVVDIMLSLILAGLAAPFTDGVDRNDKPYLADIPWLPLPWEGTTQGHGKTTP